METKIFSIYDDKAKAYMMPFYSPQTGSAIRAVVTQLKDPNSMLSQHPNDFTLYEIGVFNDQDGILDPAQPALFVGKLSDYLELSIGQSNGQTSQPLPNPFN